ncbi:hypothetical protein EJB05_31117, partial [Eragrostis curvula]
MEIAENYIASGNIRDLPPSKRFKFVNPDPDLIPCLPLPAKKRVFPPPPEAAVAVPVCLPAKKRAIVAPPSEDAIPVCLPAKKRAYAPPADAVTPACLPAKKRPYAPPPADLVGRTCVPAKKRVHAPPPREDAASSVPIPVSSKKRVHAPPPPEGAAGSVPVPVSSKQRVHAPPPREDAAGSVPVPVPGPSKKRVNAPPPREDAVVSVPAPVPSKKRDHAPSSRGDAAGLVPVSLPTNKRVMPPMPPPSVESDGARLGAVKDVKPQGSNKHGGAAINPTLANGAGGGTSEKEFKKSEKPVHPKETKELVPMKPSKRRSLIKLKDLEKKACKVLDVRHSKAEAEVNKKAVEATHSKQSARKEESRNAYDEVARDEEPVKPSKPRSSIKGEDLEKKACKILDVRHSKAEVSKKAVQATNAKKAEREESRNAADEVARDEEEEAVEEDDGVLCTVCRSTDGDPSDPIVFCDGCDLMVHASCYGNPLAQSIPDGDWFCSLCSAKKSKAAAAARPSCCLCPATGGAMKRTTEGQWAHIACALLVPEVFFRDPDGRDGIDCSRVPAHRFTKECYICESSSGCALECSQPKCNRGFHVSCGLDGGLCIEYREEKGGAIVAGFCREHTELWEKQQLTGKYKIVARGHE